MTNSRRRPRAVRLTDDALAMLQRGLADIWRDVEPDGRLTRNARASLLGVSIATGDRIFDRQGNDRAVLQQAFLSIGLEWSESYCEPVVPESAIEQLQSAPLPDPDRETQKTRLPHGSSNRRFCLRRTVLLLAGAIGVFVLILAGTFAITRPNPKLGDIAGTNWPRNAYHLAWKAYHAGRFVEAARLVEATKVLAVETSDIAVVAESLRLEGELLAAEGRLDEALSRYNESLVLRNEFKFDQARGSLLEVIGVVETRLGRFLDAQIHLTESFRLLKEVEDHRGMAGTARSLGSLAIAKGNRREARFWFVEAEKAMADDPDPQLQLDIRAQRAILDSREGRHDKALKNLELCLHAWRARGHKRWVATTLNQMASVRRSKGDHAGAASTAAEAVAIFETVGDGHGAEESRQMLASLSKP